MIHGSVRNRRGRAAAILLATVTSVVLWTAGSASADGDLVVKRTTLRHPARPPSAAPSLSPGRDVVILDPVPSRRPPRIPEELSPAASGSIERENACRTRLRSMFERLWRALAR